MKKNKQDPPNKKHIYIYKQQQNDLKKQNYPTRALETKIATDMQEEEEEEDNNIYKIFSKTQKQHTQIEDMLQRLAGWLAGYSHY